VEVGYNIIIKRIFEFLNIVWPFMFGSHTCKYTCIMR